LPALAKILDLTASKVFDLTLATVSDISIFYFTVNSIYND